MKGNEIAILTELFSLRFANRAFSTQRIDMFKRIASSSRSNLIQSIQCCRHIQRRFKHGRDFPRNIPPPPPPSGTPVFSTPSMTLYHSPPPSAPSYKTPAASFLPQTQQSESTRILHPLDKQLPPALTTKRERGKKYHLTQADLEEIRRLRNHPDPEQRKSRNELAKMFQCSQLFVGMVAPLPKDEVKKVFEKREGQKEDWGPRKRFYRDLRQKRRAEWTSSEEVDL